MNHRFFLITIAVIGLIVLPNFFGYPPASAAEHAKITKHLTEAFDPWLAKKITTMDVLVRYIDTSYKEKRNTEAFLNYISAVVSSRFYHGYTYYTLSDNWVAALAGKLIWKDLSAIVIPDDILRHYRAACSQQEIVLMQSVKHFGMDYRQIFFDHHFAAEVKAGGKWHYVDVNQEIKAGDQSLEDLINNGTLYSLYRSKMPANEIQTILGHPRYGKINSQNAPKAELFQEVTGWISRFFFPALLCVQLFLLYWYKMKYKKLLAPGKMTPASIA
jgi:hypothetical protein